jgi:hypothetical protein
MLGAPEAVSAARAMLSNDARWRGDSPGDACAAARDANAADANAADAVVSGIRRS